MLLISYGTRPEWLKVKPLVKLLKEKKFPLKVLFTGQHNSLMVEDFYFDLQLKITDEQNRLDSIITSVLNKESIFAGVEKVLVQGDTASAYAVALAAFHRRKKIIHLEAGLRTYDKDNPYPEEFYRRSISCMADINLCVSEVGKSNITLERAPGRAYVVGNTILDNIAKKNIRYGDKVLITMHRRENHGLIGDWFEAFESLANKNKDLNFILPIHPNPNVIRHAKILNMVKAVDPLGHEELLEHISECRLVITDSGGIQEESSFLGKKSIVCRKKTERVEGLGQFSFLCPNPTGLERIFYDINGDYRIRLPCPYGDGDASKKIYKILIEG